MTKSTFQIQDTIDGKPTILFTIKEDGTIERGPGFTTNDEMSLKFWEAVEKSRRPLRPLEAA